MHPIKGTVTDPIALRRAMEAVESRSQERETFVASVVALKEDLYKWGDAAAAGRQSRPQAA